MAAMVREFPESSSHGAADRNSVLDTSDLLALGQLGIRILIDARQPSGWQTLRDILAAERSSDLQRTALGHLSADLTGASTIAGGFLSFSSVTLRRIHTVRQLSRHLCILPSTLMSRFFRANLPTPKRYLALARLIRAAKLFENPGLSVASVANYLDYSSPQSFGRHIRTMMEISPVTISRAVRWRRNASVLSGGADSAVCRDSSRFQPAVTCPGWITRQRNLDSRSKPARKQ